MSDFLATALMLSAVDGMSQCRGRKEVVENAVDFQNEYNLILQKKSKLSARKRANIVRKYERLMRVGHE